MFVIFPLDITEIHSYLVILIFPAEFLRSAQMEMDYSIISAIWKEYIQGNNFPSVKRIIICCWQLYIYTSLFLYINVQLRWFTCFCMSYFVISFSVSHKLYSCLWIEWRHLPKWMLPQEGCLQASEGDNNGIKGTLLLWYVKHSLSLMKDGIWSALLFFP